MKKILFTKIHFGLALILILAVSVVSVVSSLVLFLSEPEPAEAFLGFSVGLEVLSPALKCVLDNVDGDCLASCPICGDTAVCNGLFEVRARVLTGINALYKTQALCLTSPVTPFGKSFVPGGRCFGKYFAAGPIHILFNFNCAP